MSEQLKPITMDEMIHSLSDIARDEENKDRFRAMKMLQGMNAGTNVLPAPLNDDETIERLVRLIRPAGITLVKLAYQKAFGNSSRIELPEFVPAYAEREIWDKVKHISTLNEFYAAFPEQKTSKLPRGYPTKSSFEVKKNFIQKLAYKTLENRYRTSVAKERIGMLEGLTEEAKDGTDVGTGD